MDKDERKQMKRIGYTDLPLHYGRVPEWLAQRMSRLGGVIIEASHNPDADFSRVIQKEREESYKYDGSTVFGKSI
jgi:hypothetical protein